MLRQPVLAAVSGIPSDAAKRSNKANKGTSAVMSTSRPLRGVNTSLVMEDGAELGVLLAAHGADLLHAHVRLVGRGSAASSGSEQTYDVVLVGAEVVSQL